MKSNSIVFGVYYVIFIMILILGIFGQTNNSIKNASTKLVDRFEIIIKTKKPKFKGGRSAVDIRKNRDSAYFSWKFKNDYVYVDVNDFADLEETLTVMKNYLTELRPVYQEKIKLNNLGDEAYLELSQNSAYLKIRKGRVILSISSTKSALGMRFAKYFVKEVEKRDRGY